MCINIVIILEMSSKGWNITYYGTFRPSARAIIWAELAALFVLELAIIWKYSMAAKTLVSA